MDHDRLTVTRKGKKICLLSLLDLVATQWHTCGWGDGNRDFRPGAHDSHNGQSNFAHEAREFLRERFQFRYKEGPSNRFVVPDEHSDRGQASIVGGADSWQSQRACKFGGEVMACPQVSGRGFCFGTRGGCHPDPLLFLQVRSGYIGSG